MKCPLARLYKLINRLANLNEFLFSCEEKKNKLIYDSSNDSSEDTTSK